MQYEIELKFPLSDDRVLRTRLAELGAVAGSPIDQSDSYFNHPVRDFAQSNEAFRIRSVGSANCVTYKGPVIDTATKTRREIEIPIADGAEAAVQMQEMLTQLGFRAVRKVLKTRTPLVLTWKDQRYELAIDVVPQVGTFLEIELLADESGRNAARDAIQELAEHLQLPAPEKRSYLELVIDSDHTSSR